MWSNAVDEFYQWNDVPNNVEQRKTLTSRYTHPRSSLTPVFYVYTPLWGVFTPPPSLQATPLLAVLFTPQGNAYPNTPDPAGESLRCSSCSLVRWGRALCLAVFPAYTPHRVTFWIEAYLTQPSTKTRSGRMMMPLAASTESFSLATLDFETSLVPLDGELADSLNASNDVQSLLVAALIH